MISRRFVLVGGAALTTAPLLACASLPRLSLEGSFEQGSLIVGRTVPGARVAIDGVSVRVSPQGFFAGGLAWDRHRGTFRHLGAGGGGGIGFAGAAGAG